MPYTKYICPDGHEVGIDECLTACRLEGQVNPNTGELYCPAGRCLSKRTLISKLQKNMLLTLSPLFLCYMVRKSMIT